MPKAPKSPSKAKSNARARADPVSKKPKKAATKATDSVPIDPSQWRKSTIPANQTISKALAMKAYHLRASDMAELPYAPAETVLNGEYLKPMYLYKERDVERKAWERRGGPEAFDAYHEKLCSRRDAKAAKKAQSTPSTSRNAERPPTITIGRLSPVAGSSTNFDDLIHVGKSAKLFRIREQMPRWLWDVCNALIDRVNYSDPGIGPLLIRGTAREDMMREALEFSKTYPDRPRLRSPPTPEIDRLRAILDEAPHLPEDTQWRQFNGLERIYRSWPDEDYTYEWDSAYLGRVMTALVDILRVHGERCWRSVRWEVYDKYRECFEFHCFSYTNQTKWSDKGAYWLDGRYSEGVFNTSPRSKHPIGQQYNAMLPHRTPEDVRFVGKRT
ncbi:hypothetical protein C8Q70DRAFT_428055 [Cubamyces menziesii]|nr:hypothetical protein C8Q70DRAFT_428055 [Cubamyces menziesii]